MRFRAKSLLFLCVLMSISLFGINVRAANPADFRAIYTPYINQHDAAFVIDLDNDGVPELLGLDNKGDGWKVLGWVYSINDNGNVTRHYPAGYALLNNWEFDLCWIDDSKDNPEDLWRGKQYFVCLWWYRWRNVLQLLCRFVWQNIL